MRSALLATMLALASQAAYATPADQLIARYNAAYRGLGMPYMALSYRDNIASLVRETDVAAQKVLFGAVARELKQLDSTRLPPSHFSLPHSPGAGTSVSSGSLVVVPSDLQTSCRQSPSTCVGLHDAGLPLEALVLPPASFSGVGVGSDE